MKTMSAWKGRNFASNTVLGDHESKKQNGKFSSWCWRDEGRVQKKEESVAMEYAVKQKVVGHELSIMKGTKVRWDDNSGAFSPRIEPGRRGRTGMSTCTESWIARRKEVKKEGNERWWLYDPIWIESKRNVQMIDEGLRRNGECSKKKKRKKKRASSRNEDNTGKKE